ncbi:MAG: beta-N-acetylhexosaminidase [Myxococcales bacterium]|nr:beta-N-acetylhexosaminidase [Myxococcales bacterium]
MTPVPTPAAPASADAARKLALELFVAGYEGQELPDSYAERLRDGMAGAILFSRNLVKDAHSEIDVAHLTAQTAAIARAGGTKWPALCAVDQEGGLVARLRAPFTHFAAMADVVDAGGAQAARLVGAQMGRECLAAGFNVDFAPVLDINTNPDNPIIGRRAFGTTPEAVVEAAGAFLRGMQGTGVLGCGKHFPGHGDTDTDSHLALPVLDFDMERMTTVELRPFAELADDMAMVMTAHVLFRALDSKYPATLSEKLLQPMLREHCGFGGVIVSDDLEMKGVAEAFTFAESVRLGLKAGVDLFLVCRREDALEESVDEAARILMDGGRLALRTLDAIRRVRELRLAAVRPSPSMASVQRALSHPDRAELQKRYGVGNV